MLPKHRKELLTLLTELKQALPQTEYVQRIDQAIALLSNERKIKLDALDKERTAQILKKQFPG